MRTPKQTAEIVECTIAEIDEQRDNTTRINDKLISDTCEKYQISEEHIRRVAGWKKEYIPRMSAEEMRKIKQAKALLKKHNETV